MCIWGHEHACTHKKYQNRMIIVTDAILYTLYLLIYPVGLHIKNRNLTSVDVQCSNRFMATISQYFIYKTIMSYFLNTYFGWRYNTSKELGDEGERFCLNAQSIGAWPLELQLAQHQAPELLSLLLSLCPSLLPFSYILAQIRTNCMEASASASGFMGIWPMTSGV